MKKTFLKLSLLLFVAGTSLVSCSDDDNNNNTQPQNSIVDIAASNSNFSILAQAVERAGLTATLDGAGQFTVFLHQPMQHLTHILTQLLMTILMRYL